MLYVQLDVNWIDNPKIMEVGLDGAGLHAAALCIAKRMETDGVLHRRHLLRAGGTDELIDRLIEVELLDAVDGRRVRVHGWLDRNPSHGAIAANRSAKSASGREGNHRRWGHDGPVETCLKCNPPEPDFDDRPDHSNAWSSQGATPMGSHPESQNGRNGSLVETEGKTESEGKKKRRKRRPDNPEAERLCNLFADSLGAPVGAIRPNVTDEWVTDMDKLMRLDGRPVNEVEGFIRWLGEGTHPVAEWWQPNIRSPKTLRKQWDRVKGQKDVHNRRSGRPPSRGGSPGSNATNRAWEDTQRLLSQPDFQPGADPPSLRVVGE